MTEGGQCEMKKCQKSHAVERFWAKGSHVKWKSVKNSYVMEGFRAKGGRREPKGAQWEPKGSQRGAKGSQREPNRAQRGPKGSQREPKGSQKGSQKGTLGASWVDPGGQHAKKSIDSTFFHPFWGLFWTILAPCWGHVGPLLRHVRVCGGALCRVALRKALL